MKILVLLQGSL